MTRRFHFLFAVWFLVLGIIFFKIATDPRSYGSITNHLAWSAWFFMPFILLYANSLLQKEEWITYVSFAFTTLVSFVYTTLSFSANTRFAIPTIHMFVWVIVVAALFVAILVWVSRTIFRFAKSLRRG